MKTYFFKSVIEYLGVNKHSQDANYGQNVYDRAREGISGAKNWRVPERTRKHNQFYNFSLIMALLFSQHKMIEWLEQQISKPKINLRSRLREIFRA